MITPSKFPRPKNVLVLNDVPVKLEIENEQKFSSASNMTLLTALRTGRVSVGCPTNREFKGIISTDTYQTYVDYTYFGESEGVEKNVNYVKELRKRKDLYLVNTREDADEGVLDPEAYFIEKDQETLTRKSIERLTFYKLETHKDVFVSYRLKVQLDRLLEEIEKVQPKIIVVTGKWGLFFLTGKATVAQTQGNYKDPKLLGGLKTYRASILQPHESFGIQETIVYPLYHPINAMKMLEAVPIMRLDYEKLAHMYHTVLEEGAGHYLRPEKGYLIGVDLQQITAFLKITQEKVSLEPTYVSMDIETMFSSIIDCISVATSTEQGLSIPFASLDNPLLFSEEEEIEICLALFTLIQHPNCLHVGQNYQYDTDFYYNLWDIPVVASLDTLLIHHKLYNYLPKDLAFLASLYCDTYSYWKGDIIATKETPETRWEYNAKDACYTLEIALVLQEILAQQPTPMQDLYEFESQRLVPKLDGMMRTGVLVDTEEKAKLYTIFSKLLVDLKEEVNKVIGEPEFNLNSWQQKQRVFEDLLGMELIKRKGKKTTDAAAMLDYIDEYSLYRPFLTLLLEQASLKVFTNNFLGMELDADSRVRTQYKTAGTSTGRLASTKNIRGKGANLQNIPSKGKLDLVQAASLVDGESFAQIGQERDGAIKLPNIKKIFLPDKGMEIADCDYSGADIMVVSAEAECTWLIDYFANPRGCGKVYAYVASEFFQREVSPKSKEYKVYKGVFHGSNYGMGVKKLAMMAGIPIKQARELQDFYFRLNPEIPKWQKRVEEEIRSKGYIENIFGRRGWFINSNDPMLLNKALAFTPQSTIGDIVNRALVNTEKFPEIIPLLQVHDSLVVEYPAEKAVHYRKAILSCMDVPLPYDPILIIPSDIQVSCKSYGEVA